MSKSTYNFWMKRLREKQKKQRMADDIKTVPFIPSKDVKVEYKTARFGAKRRQG